MTHLEEAMRNVLDHMRERALVLEVRQSLAATQALYEAATSRERESASRLSCLRSAVTDAASKLGIEMSATHETFVAAIADRAEAAARDSAALRVLFDQLCTTLGVERGDGDLADVFQRMSARIASLAEVEKAGDAAIKAAVDARDAALRKVCLRYHSDKFGPLENLLEAMGRAVEEAQERARLRTVESGSDSTRSGACGRSWPTPSRSGRRGSRWSTESARSWASTSRGRTT